MQLGSVPAEPPRWRREELAAQQEVLRLRLESTREQAAADDTVEEIQRRIDDLQKKQEATEEGQDNPTTTKEEPSAEKRYGNPTWIPDDEYEACMLCDEDFWLFRRRHHCRCCGNLVCDECSEGRRELARIVGPDAGGTTAGVDGEKYRVCNDCESR